MLLRVINEIEQYMDAKKDLYEKLKKENESIMATKKDYNLNAYTVYLLNIGKAFSPYLDMSVSDPETLSCLADEIFSLYEVKKIMKMFKNEAAEKMAAASGTKREGEEKSWN